MHVIYMTSRGSQISQVLNSSSQQIWFTSLGQLSLNQKFGATVTDSQSDTWDSAHVVCPWQSHSDSLGMHHDGSQGFTRLVAELEHAASVSASSDSKQRRRLRPGPEILLLETQYITFSYCNVLIVILNYMKYHPGLVGCYLM